MASQQPSSLYFFGSERVKEHDLQLHKRTVKYIQTGVLRTSMTKGIKALSSSFYILLNILLISIAIFSTTWLLFLLSLQNIDLDYCIQTSRATDAGLYTKRLEIKWEK
jgi:hypothetical protein